MLIRALTHEDNEVRISAAIALGNIGDARALDALTLTAKDKDRGVRGYSEDALRKIKAKNG